MKAYAPSLLEKLFDDEPLRPSLGLFKSHNLEEFKSAVALDVEALLNSRFVMDIELIKEFEQCKKSILTYGLGDISSRSMASSDDRVFICQSLSECINNHEPRLKDVKITLSGSQGESGGLRFSISAMLIVHPSREPVNFDALLQPSTLQYRVIKSTRFYRE